MAQRVYATDSDYTALAEEDFDGTPGKLLKRLRSASIEVEKITRLAVYETDEDGYPTDADVSEAFTEATCAIVEYWELTGDSTGAEALAGAVKIGSVSLGTSTTSRDRPSDALADRIGTRAVDILANAGLTTAFVGH